MRRFEISLSDVDRGVYEALDLRAAQHPSESDRYLVARVLARALEHAEGVDFTKGLDADDEPALWQRDLRGDLVAWIEVGSPSSDRLHRANKKCKRVVVYAWKTPEALAAQLVTDKVFKVETIEIRAIDPAFLDELVATLDRQNAWELSITDGAIYLGVKGLTLETTIPRVA